MSKITWDRLSERDQRLVRKAAALSVPIMRDLWDARVSRSRQIVLDAGNEVIENVEKQPFIDAMSGIYDQFAGTPALQDLVARIQAVSVD